MRKELKPIVEALEAQGFTTQQTAKGRTIVRKAGVVVAIFAAHAKDHHADDNEMARLRRAGFAWRR